MPKEDEPFRLKVSGSLIIVDVYYVKLNEQLFSLTTQSKIKRAPLSYNSTLFDQIKALIDRITTLSRPPSSRRYFKFNFAFLEKK